MTKRTEEKTPIKSTNRFAKDESGGISLEMGLFAAMAMIGAISSLDIIGDATQRMGEKVIYESVFVAMTPADGLAVVQK